MAHTIRIIPNQTGSPAGKLADAELIFDQTDPALAGLKLCGFAIWERRHGTGRNVTFPSRTYSVNGERRSFALLRPDTTGKYASQDAMRDLVLKAYADHEAIAALVPDASTTTKTTTFAASTPHQAAVDAL